MITDLDLAELCLGIYAYPSSPPVTWDHYDHGTAGPGVCWGVKRVDGIDCVILRGSYSFEDWVRDFGHFAIAEAYPGLGRVHPGFHAGMPQVWSVLKPLLGPQAAVSGHSLGAGRTDDLCGLMLLDGYRPAARVVFGEPKPGLAQLAELVAQVPGRSYCNSDANGHDLVTDVPLTFPPEDYTRPTPLIRVSQSPPASDSWGPFRYHHAELYVEALRKA